MPKAQFKVPKAVPTWVDPFFRYVNNPKIFKLFEDHWESFFNENFVPPKPRKPADPVKQFEKGVKGLATIMDSDQVSEEDKKKLSEAVSQVASFLPEGLKEAIDSSSPVSGSKKRKRGGKKNVKEKLTQSYETVRHKLMENSSSNVDMDDVMRSLDDMYDTALTAVVVEEEEEAEEE
jgi:hypothetical protein